MYSVIATIGITLKLIRGGCIIHRSVFSETSTLFFKNLSQKGDYICVTGHDNQLLKLSQIISGGGKNESLGNR